MKIAPYGSWPSPVSPELVAGKSSKLTDQLVCDQKQIYFLEARPSEKGRCVLMRIDTDGSTTEVLPKEYNVRTRYLEYGASSYTVTNNVVYFVNDKDQQLYRFVEGSKPKQITKLTQFRFADPFVEHKRNRLIVLCEQEHKPEPKNFIAAIDLDSGELTKLVEGSDFYNNARISPDGKHMIWTSWNHPNMAWNGTELWLAELSTDGIPTNTKKIAGDSTHGVIQARFTSNDTILFTAELEHWLNLYQWHADKVTKLCPMDAEFSYPGWVPGEQHFDRNGKHTCAAFTQNGTWHLLVKEEGKNAVVCKKEFADIARVLAFQDGFLALIEHTNCPETICFIDKHGSVTEVYRNGELELSKEDISIPEAINFSTADGNTGHAWFYPPQNKNYQGREGELPPLIVKCHGGPTVATTASFSKAIQFWTSRGYAFVDINYGGSTGFGRNYRQRLEGNWGIVDVQDAVSAVNALVQAGKVDPKRVAIRGGSAGGYTVLAALTFTDGVFSVGASYYGVSELEVLAKETHKLEARYMDQLVGPYPETIELYKERSPINFVEKLNCPIIFFQGVEDKVVPPNQAEMMVNALKKKEIPTEYYLYEGEGLGFRMAETVQNSLKAEHSFYARFFDFEVQPEDRL